MKKHTADNQNINPAEEKDGEKLENSAARESGDNVTENGEVYHTFSDCTHIDLSISAVGISAVGNLRNENGGRYSACEKCPDENGTDTVYITQYGDRYHSSLSCSGLKRSVRLVEISKAEGLSECERCASRR